VVSCHKGKIEWGYSRGGAEARIARKSRRKAGTHDHAGINEGGTKKLSLGKGMGGGFLKSGGANPIRLLLLYWGRGDLGCLVEGGRGQYERVRGEKWPKDPQTGAFVNQISRERGQGKHQLKGGCNGERGAHQRKIQIAQV